MGQRTNEAIFSKVSTGSVVSFEAFGRADTSKPLSESIPMANEHSNPERS